MQFLNNYRVQSATKEALSSVIALLQECELPTADISVDNVSMFTTISLEHIVAVAALEQVGDYALFRSLAVHPGHRGQSIAQQLLAHIEQQAKEASLHQLFLLTYDADSWFLQHGWHRIERSSAPESIQQTAQFSGLCVCMCAYV